MLRVSLTIVTLVLCFFVVGCRQAPIKKDYSRPLPPGAPALVRVSPDLYPDIRSVHRHADQALEAVEQSLEYFDKPSSKKHFPYSTEDRSITHADQQNGLERLRTILQTARSGDEFEHLVYQSFDVYQSAGWDAQSGEVLFTAYYTPIFKGSMTKNETFKYPLYRRPNDLVTETDGTPRGRRTGSGALVPYYSRAEIENSGYLSGGELVYLADPFETFIVHVQGSARIELPDGRHLDVGYAGKTDRPYRSLGAEMIRRGKLEADEVSLKTLKDYFAAYPEDVGILDVNESYVFFQHVTEPGPFGSLGARVTPYHTVATDKSVFPRGGPVIASTHLPETDPVNGEIRMVRHTGLYLDQDTGGAIRSAGRADLYLGTGPAAEQVAGYTNREGQLYYLFPKRP